MIFAIIVACEIGFWVAVVGGLAARYVLRRARLGAILLAAAPVVDLVLLTAVAIDLRSGAEATWAHGLAALYIGVSIAYGRAMVHWADARFAHRFSGGPAPVRATGAEYTRACWRDVGRTALALAVAAALLGAMIAWVGAPERTAALSGFFPLLGTVLGIEFLWALSYTIWPRRPADRVGAPA